MSDESNSRGIVQTIKENPFAPLLNSVVLCCFYVKDNDSTAITDQGGFIPTRSECDELVHSILKFYEETSDEEIIAHNEELYQQRFSQPKAKNVMPTKPRVKQPGHVYLMRAMTDPTLFKIGRTRDLPSRMRTFGLKLPFAVELFHSIEAEDTIEAESYLHNKYDAKRTNGEWFSLSQEDVDWICSLRTFERHMTDGE